jgi:sigma-E factor negative regulatory protein RseB
MLLRLPVSTKNNFMVLAQIAPKCLLCLLITFVALFGTATAQEPQAAVRSLERARDAAERLEYTGILITQQGPQMNTSRIIHKRESKEAVERIEMLDGQPNEIVRRGEEVTWYLPRERRIIIDRQPGARSFPGIAQLSNSQLLEHYRFRFLQKDRVAGRESTVLQLQPLDGLRYGYRFWIDTNSGLLLRAQSISERGDVVAQIGFSEVTIGAQPPSRGRDRLIDTRGWQTERAVTGPADVSGWVMQLPPGFVRLAAQRRVIAAAHSGIGEPRDVVQIVCSDGLASISIFVEPWSAARSAVPVQEGALNMVGKRIGRFWLTIVGEVPMTAVRQIADSLEFSAPVTR